MCECFPDVPHSWLGESSVMDCFKFTTFGCFIWLFLHLSAHVNGFEGCQSPQYLELDQTGTIQCSFIEGFFGLYWYNSTDTVTEEPILNLKGSARSGPGFISGEFDIHSNGSLIINHVTIHHHHRFSVVKLNTRDDHPTPHVVYVVTTARPSHDFPLISNCKKEERLCLMQLSKSSDLSCVVKDSRPMTELTWASRSTSGDQEIPSTVSVTNDTVKYTSRITIRGELLQPLSLALYVCKATTLPPLLLYSESLIITERGSRNYSTGGSITRYFMHDSEMMLGCSRNDSIIFLVWKKITQNGDEHEEHVVTLFVKNTAESIFQEDIKTDEEGALIVSNVDMRHEGKYACIYSDGEKEAFIIYNVFLYIVPDPPNPVVSGCENSHFCSLIIETGGSLTCSIRGIRPEVELEWSQINDTTSDVIKFVNEKTNVKNNGETFDITMTTQILIEKSSDSRFIVECKVAGQNFDLFDLSTKVDILVTTDIFELTTHPVEDLNSPSNNLVFLWVFLAAVGLLIVGVTTILLFKFIKQQNIINNKLEELEEGENVPMVDPTFTEIKKMFIKQLKVKYQTLYDAVQPIPYIKDKLYCVDSVYVERGIEVMVAKDQTGQQEIWECLDSYHKLLPKIQAESKRSLLEGEAGYGKSTLTLQLAYDWCNRVDRSPLKDIEILVILRLRQLGRMPSIYQAIRQVLLPKDSVLEVSDIENIIQKTNSIVIILDGYDEYPDQDKLETDVINIIQRDMFQQIHVILTTRSSCLPQDFAPHTKRVRLNGFDETARDKYIRKAIAGSDDMVANKIKRRLIENPVLGDLCQVPLFFVMFAHMINERKEFEQFNSVTSFFSYMISCFHSHMRNKVKDKNVKEFNYIETNHGELDKLALEGLCDVRMVWDRDEMCSKLGDRVYKHYIKMGILIEEEILDMLKGPELFEYKTEVRFYHKIFCEWYAAHLLAEYAVDNTFSDLRETLQRLDPFDLHYVYRFACGLKPSAAENILQYLKSIREGEQFSVLCILEQKGKMNNIRETVADLCSDVVVIANKDNKLQLRSTIQLLEIASSNAIPIACASIENCFQSVDLDAWNILLGSGLCFSNLSSVEELRINEMGRELTTTEVETIFKFASQCLQLRILRFDCCFLPHSLSLKKFETDLNPNKIEVQWIPIASWFRLNYDTGTWEDRFKGKVELVTSEKYETELQRFRKEWSHTHWQILGNTENGQRTQSTFE